MSETIAIHPSFLMGAAIVILLICELTKEVQGGRSLVEIIGLVLMFSVASLGVYLENPLLMGSALLFGKGVISLILILRRAPSSSE